MQLMPLYALIISLLSAVTYADDGSMIYGSGLDTCGKWNKQRASKDVNEAAAAYVMRAWILGYVSGVDAYIGSGEPFYIRNVDSSAIEQWIDGFCQDNPLSELNEAADQLIMKLAETR